MKKMLKFWGVFVVLLLSFWVITPFFAGGFFPMHDDTQVARVYEMGKALSDGHFPVRWTADLGYGYGYPLFNFYAPLPYYIGGILGMLGLDTLSATKAMMVIGILLSAIFMYLLAKEFWGEVGGVISGLFYVYAPYHAVDVYVRGAVAEFWAYSFIPLLFYGLWKVYKQPRWRWVIVGAVGLAGVILSHNLTALMLLPFLVITTLLYCYIAYKNKKLVASGYLLVALLLGLGLSVFYWLPALLEMGYTNVVSQVGGGANFRDHFVCWQQLWDSPWGFGGSAPGCIDGLSFKLGKLHIIISLMIAALMLVRVIKSKQIAISFGSFGLVVSIFLTLEISRPFWEILPFTQFIQYPWRFLVFASFFSSLIAGAVVWQLRRFNTVLYLTAGIIVFFLIFFNFKLFEPQTILAKSLNDYINEENIKWVASKISDEYMPKDFTKPKTEEEVVKKRISNEEIIVDKTQELIFITNFEKEEVVLVNIAPFPAWEGFIDKINTSYINKNNGIEIMLPPGKHEVEFSFRSTAVERLANIISIISFVVLIGGILIFRKYEED